MRNFNYTRKFSTLTINFTEVLLRQILDLGKQLNLMIRHKNVLKTSLQDILKMYWRRLEDVLKTSWRCLEEVWRCLEEVCPKRIYWFWSRHLEDALKTSSEDIWLRRIYSSWLRRLEDVFLRCLLKAITKDVFKTSSSRQMFAGTYPWGQKKPRQ